MKTVKEMKDWLAKQPEDAFFAVPFEDYVDHKSEEVLIVQYGRQTRDPERMNILSSLNLKDEEYL